MPTALKTAIGTLALATAACASIPPSGPLFDIAALEHSPPADPVTLEGWLLGSGEFSLHPTRPSRVVQQTYPQSGPATCISGRLLDGAPPDNSLWGRKVRLSGNLVTRQSTISQFGTSVLNNWCGGQVVVFATKIELAPR